MDRTPFSYWKTFALFVGNHRAHIACLFTKKISNHWARRQPIIIKKKNGAVGETREEDKNRSITTKKYQPREFQVEFSMFSFRNDLDYKLEGRKKKRTNKIIQFHRTGPGRNFLILKNCENWCIFSHGVQLLFHWFTYDQ